jgi:hypothetical protein
MHSRTFYRADMHEDILTAIIGLDESVENEGAERQSLYSSKGGEASPVGRPDFKSGKGPPAGPWWVRLPLSSATTPSVAALKAVNLPLHPASEAGAYP